MRKTIAALLCSGLILVYFTGCNLNKPKETSIEISSQKAVYGTPFSIKVSNLAPGDQVDIETVSSDARGAIWKAGAVFKADRRGEVDLEKDAPISGDYKGSDALGLFWSMKPEGKDQNELLFSYDRDKPLIVDVSVTDASGAVMSAVIERYYEDPLKKLAVTELNDNGLKGSLYSPTADKKYPGIILLSGSGGGDVKWLAKAMASDGFSVLTLPYFNYTDLPDNLINIPLEYFEKAVRWMKSQSVVKEGNIGLVGGSRGGELVLQLGSMFDEFDAIVAWSPAAHLWQGEDYMALVPSWTYDGEALPYLGCNFSEEEMQRFMRGEITSFVEYFKNCLNNSDPAMVEKASIPVERIRANLFFLAGTDDATWPSSDYVDMMLARLDEKDFKYEARYICAQGAGHMVFLPDLITGYYRNYNGGTPEKELPYSQEAWREALHFLHKYLD
jgi:dienelactone hydrolase